MGLKGDSSEGDVRSYQVLSRVQGEAGNACDGRMKCARGCMGGHGGSKEPARQDHWVSHLHHCHLRRRPPSLQVVWNTGECLLTARGNLQGLGFTATSRPCTQDLSHACSPCMRKFILCSRVSIRFRMTVLSARSGVFLICSSSSSILD